MINFMCKQCGRCCKELILEIMEIDLLREPRLKECVTSVHKEGFMVENPFEQIYLLPSPCPFLVENKCSIYSTRPNLCVAFADKCLLNYKGGHI